ncbi:MAG: sodium-translocating pyrophosphatase [Propionicimonas sp.]|uniref:sodium-translocating pyrophosphatase n=1 Tax=Propionicimonas sp. TaxID=1955623 RepID=UPI002B1FF38E|nr:sodium-translocating pyrophosphatase [Propionicimonas sp.]MEA4942961.1 sodium-translocating pyrophosphatase [Propionicimonas sp.]MEA5118110.1 sodium-translocating pyrophosphatase [Propionicimonas sp.]
MTTAASPDAHSSPHRAHRRVRSALLGTLGLAALTLTGCAGGTGEPSHTGHTSEFDLPLPDIWGSTVGGVNGGWLLVIGLLICLAGFAFGLISYMKLKNLPVHTAMREVSELIYETCKAYLLQQGRFLLMLFAFIGAVIFVYFGFLNTTGGWGRVVIVLLFAIIGMAGSYAIAWYGIRLNTFANSRTSHAALRGKPFDVYNIPMRSGMSVGMVLISTELIMMLAIMLFLPADIATACFLGFAIGESLGASALRIAGGIFTKIADIGSDLMKIVFKIGEDDPRNPGTIADCTGDNAGDSVGPSADGFETYGVTGVALITFILLGVQDGLQAHFLVWIFFIRAIMLVASALSYFGNSLWAKSKFGDADEMEFETPLTSLVWLTSIVSIALTFGISAWLMSDIPGQPNLWWQLALIISFGTLAGAIIPELVKVFTGVKAKHTQEVVKSAKEGGASLDILSGLVAGNFSAYWLGIAIVALMAGAYGVSTLIPGDIMLAPGVFALGLVAFGFLGMGPVTIAVDSYGPVTDNAQSVYELSQIEQIPDIEEELQKDFGITANFERAKYLLEANDGAGNTFKATAKPVLIGTAAVGATTMIFSIIMGLTSELTTGIENLSLLHVPFLLGLITGGAIIYWFTGASTQAVTTGSFRAVEFIKQNINLESSEKASVKDSRRVVEICTQYAQKGMFNIFLGIFFATLAFAFVEPYFFIGYLISIAIFGLYQAIFMANAGGAWDNAKKIVEVDLQAKGTDLHDASIVGDTVGDPFKDTSSVALNPVIKFTTLFGMLAIELSLIIGNPAINAVLAVVFGLASIYMVWRSFYQMRIDAPMLTKDDFKALDTKSGPELAPTTEDAIASPASNA